jgi:hypothetical protein
MKGGIRNPNPCRNMNHGRSNTSINFCPECGGKFTSQKSMACGAQKHMGYRKQRFNFCIDCGGSLVAPVGKR